MKNLKAIRSLSIAALIGPILFTAAWLILGFLSPGFTIYGVTITPYSPLSAQISALGLGETAIYMNIAFVLTGLLMLLGLIGVFWKMDEVNQKTPGLALALLALTPIGAILDGFFTINSGFIHYAISLLAFFAPVVSFLVAGLKLRRVPQWKRFGNWLLVGSPLTLLLLVLFFLTFVPTPQGQQVGVGGLAERILVTEIFFWYAALGWITLRRMAGTKSMSASQEVVPSRSS